MFLPLPAYYCFCHVGVAAFDILTSFNVTIIDVLHIAANPVMSCSKALVRSQSPRESFEMQNLFQNGVSLTMELGLRPLNFLRRGEVKLRIPTVDQFVI